MIILKETHGHAYQDYEFFGYDSDKDTYLNKSTYEFMKFLVDKRDKHASKSRINETIESMPLPYYRHDKIGRELDGLLKEIYSICNIKQKLMKRTCAHSR